MHRMLVLVFDGETKAEKGKNELLKLDSEGTLSIYGYDVVAKRADGTVVVEQADGRGTLSPFGESLLKSLSDSTPSILAAPQPGDSAMNLKKTETGKDFISGVKEVLLPNRVAILVEAEEEWPTLLDIRMGAIGGAVFRWAVSEVRHAVEMQNRR